MRSADPRDGCRLGSLGRSLVLGCVFVASSLIVLVPGCRSYYRIKGRNVKAAQQALTQRDVVRVPAVRDADNERVGLKLGPYDYLQPDRESDAVALKDMGPLEPNQDVWLSRSQPELPLLIGGASALAGMALISAIAMGANPNDDIGSETLIPVYGLGRAGVVIFARDDCLRRSADCEGLEMTGDIFARFGAVFLILFAAVEVVGAGMTLAGLALIRPSPEVDLDEVDVQVDISPMSIDGRGGAGGVLSFRF